MDWDRFVGIGWRDRGRSLEEGVDCWGLVRAAFEHGTGLELPSHADGYATAADRRETAAIYGSEVSDWSRVDVAAPFDAAVFVAAGRLHVGLIVRPGLVLHIEAQKTSVIVPIERVSGVRDGYFRHRSRVSDDRVDARPAPG